MRNPVFFRMRVENRTSWARAAGPISAAMRSTLSLHLLARTAVHHGEQVVGPQRQMTRPLIAMGDEIERADLGADLGDRLVGHVPHRHAIGGEAERVMIGNRADAADRALVEQPPQARDDFA